MTQGKTQTCDLATGLPCSSQLSYSATHWLSSSTELAGNQPKSQSSYQAGGGVVVESQCPPPTSV